MRLTAASLGLLLSTAILSAQNTILTATDATIQLPGTETWLAAAPGMALHTGYKLRTATGTLRFTFCPDHTEQTLLPARELILPECNEPATARGVVVPHDLLPGTSGKTYALLIGISEYPKESPMGNLKYAHADALKFAEFLATPKGGALPPSQIKLLINSQ